MVPIAKLFFDGTLTPHFQIIILQNKVCKIAQTVLDIDLSKLSKYSRIVSMPPRVRYWGEVHILYLYIYIYIYIYILIVYSILSSI